MFMMNQRAPTLWLTNGAFDVGGVNIIQKSHPPAAGSEFSSA
jgi:hypothetical protein